MAGPNYVSAGALATSSQNGTSVTPAYPSGVLAGDKLILVIGQKPSTANGGTVTTPSGWRLVGSSTGKGGYGTTLSADQGNTNVFIFERNADGTETGNLAVTVGTNNVCWAQITRFTLRTSTNGWGKTVASFGERTTTPTSSLSVAFSGHDLTTQDTSLHGMVIPTDITTPSQFTQVTIAQSGATLFAAAEISEPDSGTGNDIGGVVGYRIVDTGTGSGNLTFSATLAGTLTNVRGPVFAVRIREITPTSFGGLVDDFDTLDATVWDSSLASSNGSQIVFSNPGYVRTVLPYALTGSEVYVEWDTPAWAGFRLLASPDSQIRSMYYVEWSFVNSQLEYGVVDATGSKPWSGSTILTWYCYRWRHSGSTVYLEGSNDGTSWTLIGSTTHQISLGKLYLQLDGVLADVIEGVNVLAAPPPTATDYWGAAA